MCKDFDRREQALAWASDVFAALALGRPVEKAGRLPLSLDKFAETFLDKFSTNNRDRVSLAHLRRQYGTRRLDSIAEWHVRRYITDRRAAGASNKSINHEIGALRHMLYVAVRSGYLEERPEISWHTLMLPMQSRERVYSEAELAIVRAALPAYLVDPFDLALMTGLRRGDLIHITREQVDEKERTLTIRQRKNSRPLVIPLVPAAMAIIARNRANFERCGYLLANTQGKALRSFQHAWQRARKLSKVKGVTWHDLRHTFATRLVQAGAPRDVLAKLIGDTPMVAAMYANVSMAHKREILEKACRSGVADLGVQQGTTGHLQKVSNSVNKR